MDKITEKLEDDARKRDKVMTNFYRTQYSIKWAAYGIPINLGVLSLLYGFYQGDIIGMLIGIFLEFIGFTSLYFDKKKLRNELNSILGNLKWYVQNVVGEKWKREV